MSKMFEATLVADAKNGVAVICGFSSNVKITLIGASCEASVRSGTKDVQSISFRPAKGEEAVAAIRTLYRVYGKDAYYTEVEGLIRLYWKDDKLVVDLGPYFCRQDHPYRLGQVGENNILSVTTRGQVFSSRPNGYNLSCNKEKEEELLRTGVRFVDADLLCGYLVGNLTFEELEAVATGDQRTVEQIRYMKLQDDLCDALEKYGQIQEDHLALQEKHLKLQSDYLKISESNGILLQTMNTHIDQLKKWASDYSELRRKYDRTLGQKVKRLRDKWRNAFREPNGGGVM